MGYSVGRALPRSRSRDGLLLFVCGRDTDSGLFCYSYINILLDHTPSQRTPSLHMIQSHVGAYSALRQCHADFSHKLEPL